MVQTREERLARKRERNRRWAAANPEKVSASQKKYREANPEIYREAQKRHRENNPGRYLELQRARYASNPDRHREVARRNMRDRKIGRGVDEREYADIIVLDPCSYCGSRVVTIDHIDPVSLGGKNSWDNFTPACRSCNSSKNSTPLLFALLRMNSC